MAKRYVSSPSSSLGMPYCQAPLSVAENKTSSFSRFLAQNVKQSLRVGIPKPELGNETLFRVNSEIVELNMTSLNKGIRHG